ncbi:Alanine--tRNA ligase [Aquisphaera giovannonii]|uniref:Alanine--tRNA ligase n=1 Tax=Aquisphaera giovannonii TaxID=406548 RepID=A0A5B9WBQ0_9BACT|nr:alanine--tRNA ligase [Aquisphaera giovannonii]QEH37441.1 Alanine--tRNA ligase [Aquisphaera giovannonii]
MKTDELREAYLDFFASKGCVRRASDVLVPRDDPTVLFTPAGMNQFKREFMGLGDPSFRKAATCQKCIRTGDIENVGKTPRHMTFFEMLGNFSFGDYFKRDAIHWAWEFLTKTLSIPRERLTFTVYLDDDEAYDIWHKEVGVPAERIKRMGEDDNFWPAGAPTHGPNGVCGPCSEIFYHGDGIEEVEIWNLVFTQFNRVGPGQLEPLPQKNIDTGMGLERAAAALQGVPSNFEIDIFRPMVAAAADVLGIDYAKVKDTLDGVRIRRAADHARALTFCIHENVQPGPEKQGYVIRRLLRRAVLDAYQMGQREPFLHKLPPVIAEAMQAGYPELKDSVPRIQNVIREEEERFLRNLENGIGRLGETFRKTRAGGSDVIAGADAFDLHSTYGIPVEVTESLATDQNLRVDMEGFKKAQEEFSKISRGTAEAADVFALSPLDTLKEAYHHGSEFLGYEGTEAEGKVIGILEQNALAQSARETPGGPPIALILDRSPFYAESGGQVGDVGTIRGEGFEFTVEDTKKDRDFILHIGRVAKGEVDLNATATATVDASRRQAIRRAHSATHLLHRALHEHLGKHAQQAGSKVEPDRLRFDFANPEAVGAERLEKIENTVNQLVMTGSAVNWKHMPIAEAKALGAMALFGEKYPDVVRVVQMGDFSKELCGGTHLDNVGQVGLFKILGEESVAAGTRRITALTGQAALDFVNEEEDVLAQAAAALRVPQAQVGARIAALLEEIKTLKKQATQRKAEPTEKVSVDELVAGARPVNSATVVVRAVPGANPDEMRVLIDGLRRKVKDGLAVLLLSEAEGKVSLVAGLSKDLVDKGLHAGNWLKKVAPVVGGGGGGRPDLAQAGGKDPAKIPDAIEAALQAIEASLGA